MYTDTRHAAGADCQSDTRMTENHVEVEEEFIGPVLSFPLEEDYNQKDQLFSFRKDPAPSLTKPHRPTEQQLLQEGKLGNSEFSARLRKVTYGTFDMLPACLFLVRVDFVPKKGGWFRYRNATVEVAFEDVDDGDDDDEEEYKGPVVRKFYPELIRGHIQSAVETYNISFTVPVEPMSGAGINTGWSVSSPTEGLHLIHGALKGDPETRVKWILNENEVSKSGIYEQPTFAVIIRHMEERPFVLSLSMKATTYGGLPIKGKQASRITFKPPNMSRQQQPEGQPTLPGLSRGSMQIGNQTWNAEQEPLNQPLDLDSVDLERLTQMKANVLGQQGPGAGSSVSQGGSLPLDFVSGV